MNQHMFKCAVFVFLLIGFTGCATYPPPTIVGDKATNFKYQCSVDVPPGWDAYTKLPKDLKSQMSQIGTDKLSLALVNKKSQGMILFINEKNFSNFDKVLERPDSDWKEIGDKFLKEMENEAEIESIKSDMKIENLHANYNNYKSRPESFKSQSWLEVEADLSFTMVNSTVVYAWFVYPCHKRHFCQNMVVSISETDKYATIRPALDEVLESLMMHDVDHR